MDLDFEVENNVWLVGDDSEVSWSSTPPTRPDPSSRRSAAGGSLMIACTHGHNDHINVAADVAAGEAPIALHPADRMLWDSVYPHRPPDVALSDGEPLDRRRPAPPGAPHPWALARWRVPPARLRGVVFGGDTLFKGGPGRPGRSYSDFGTIIASIRDRLLALPPADRRAHRVTATTPPSAPKHPHLQEWIDRGH